jgi:hypothetical protein
MQPLVNSWSDFFVASAGVVEGLVALDFVAVS